MRIHGCLRHSVLQQLLHNGDRQRAARASSCGKRTVVGRRTVHLPQLHERRVRIRRERRDELTPKSELGETTD